MPGVLPPEARELRNAADDPDGDGMDNQSEMAAGTDPTNPDSCLRILSFRADGGVLSGDIQTTTGCVYYVDTLKRLTAKCRWNAGRGCAAGDGNKSDHGNWCNAGFIK
ncbi:MAG: thrombospondin type 3 repeat-containing protein [Kiritimatiellae bacterium]|jgi:hypothetical protein|nr:thrombospondin type 3 repeat-containing protein [Kiritimatiellia bacterium]